MLPGHMVQTDREDQFDWRIEDREENNPRIDRSLLHLKSIEEPPVVNKT